MCNRTYFITIILFIAEWAYGADVMHIKFPEKNWALELAVSSTQISLNQNIENRMRYVTGSAGSDVPWSVRLERTTLKTTSEYCANFQLFGLLRDGSITDRRGVVMRQQGDIVILNFTMGLPDSAKMVRKYGFVARDEVCGWIHVSSRNPSKQTEKIMEALIASARIVLANSDPNAPAPPALVSKDASTQNDTNFSSGNLSSTISGEPWLIEIPIADFKPGFRENRGPKERYFGGKIETNGLDFSAMIFPYAGGQTAANCREYHMREMKQRGIPAITAAEQREYESEKVPVLEYTDKVALGGGPSNLYHIHAWYFREGYCSVLHFSKENITQTDRERIVSILRSVQFKPKQP